MRVVLFSLPVDCLPIHEVIAILMNRFKAGNRTRIVTLNPEMVMAAGKSPVLHKVIISADLVIPDGIGVVLSLRRRGYRTERIAGIDLAYLLMTGLSQMGGKVFLVGGAPGVAAAAGERLARELPGLQIVGTTDGFFSIQDDQLIVERILAAQPDLLIAGMGMPRQELWLGNHWRNLNVPMAIGVGGSIDVWAGRIPRAPIGMQRLGMEWIYRVWMEPHRWRRLLRLFGFVSMAVFDSRRKGVNEDEPYLDED